MNAIERIKVIKAMELLARYCNNEDYIEAWLIDGVADGEIDDGDLSVNGEDLESLSYYMRDDRFADLMDTFLYCMSKAYKDGGLYVDRVVSKHVRYPSSDGTV